MRFNPYFLGAAFFVFVAVAMAVVARYLWALPFAGGALALYFLGMGRESDSDGGGR